MEILKVLEKEGKRHSKFNTLFNIYITVALKDPSMDQSFIMRGAVHEDMHGPCTGKLTKNVW